MKTYIVTFYNMSGEPLGEVEVTASTESKAKKLANEMFTCSWVSQAAEQIVK